MVWDTPKNLVEVRRRYVLNIVYSVGVIEETSNI
jgi:hypothetical protein